MRFKINGRVKLRFSADRREILVDGYSGDTAVQFTIDRDEADRTVAQYLDLIVGDDQPPAVLACFMSAKS